MKKESGLTLVEMLVSITIFGTLILVFVALYLMGIKVYNREFKLSNLQNENGIILNNLNKDLKGAIGVEESYLTYTSDLNSTIIIKVPSFDTNKDFIYDGNDELVFDRIVYKKSGAVLTRYAYPDPLSSRATRNSQISINNSAFGISYDPNITNPESISVTLTSQDVSGKETVTVTNNSKILMRNN